MTLHCRLTTGRGRPVAVAATVPGSDFRLLDGVGHLPRIGAPGAVAATIDALRGRLG